MVVRKAMMGSLLVLLGTCAAAWASPEHMQKLPSSSLFGCLICHETAEPTTANMNVFGIAFEDNGLRWDATLASVSSDPDGCTNGFELGDEDGDGKLDENVMVERFNPGKPDCQVQITDKAWGALKALFR